MADGIEVGHGYVSISADARDAVKQVERQFGGAMPGVGKKAGEGLGGGMVGAAKKFVGPLVALFAADKIKDFFGEAIKGASDLEQSTGGVDAVFGKFGKSIKAAADTASTSVGLTKDEFQSLATVIGAGLKNKGIKDFGNQTKDLISLGSDLSAQFGGSTKDAVDAIGAAMRGESDPIERYGVSLNETAVNAVLAAKGQTKLKGAALDQAKAQARLSILFKQTSDAQGAFSRESDTFAHKQQVAAAQWDNLKAAIGNAFLPVATQAMGFISDKMIPALGIVSDAVQVFFGALQGDEVTTVGPLGRIGDAAYRIRDAFVRVKPAVDAFLKGSQPILAQFGGFIATRLVPAFLGIVGAGQRLGAVVLPIIKQIAAAFLREWPKIQPIIAQIFGTIGGIVLDVMGLIKNRIQTVTAVIQFIWSRWGKQITTIVISVFKTVANVIGGAMKIVGGIVKVITGIMTGDWRKAGQGIKQIVAGIKQIVVAIWQNIKTQVQTILGTLLTALRNKWNDFLSWVGSKLRAGLARVKDFVLTPIRAARDALGSILGQISGKFSSAVTAIGRAWDGLKDKAKAPIRFVVETVLNNGLIAAFNKIAGAVGIGKLPNVALPRGFHDGGWTGPGSKLQPAGVVHADEFVIQKSARRAIESQSPGLLDYMNRTGSPGYAGGGLVGGSGRFTARFARVLEAAQSMLGTHFSIFQRGFRPRTSYSGTSHAGDAVDLGPVTARVVAVLRKLGVAAWRRGPAQGFSLRHIHGVPLPGYGSAGGSGVWQAQDYLRGGDGLGGRDYEKRGGTLAKIGEWIKSGFDSVLGWFRDLISDPLAKLKSIGNSPFAQLASGGAHLISEGMLNKAKKFDSGGYLQPGYTLAYNGTGQPERIRTAEQERAGQRVSGVVTIAGTGLKGYIEGVVVDSIASAAMAV